MRVKLRIPRRQPGQEPGDKGFVHARILQQAKNRARVPDAALPERRPRPRSQTVMNGCVERAITPMDCGQAQVQPKRIKRQPQAPEADLGGKVHQYLKDRWMQVQMQMAIDMIEQQSSVAKLLK